MARVIKLKQSDIEKIVKNVIKEQEMSGDSDSEIMDYEQDIPEQMGDSGVELSLGMDDEGNYYVMTKDGKVVTKTK